MLHFFASHTNRVFDSSRDFPEAIFLRKFMSVVERSIAQKASTAADLRFVLVSHKCWIHSATTSFKMFSRLFFSTTAAVRCEIISSSYAMVMTRSGLCVAAMFCWFRCGWQLPICFFLLCTLKQPTISRRELWWKTCFDFCIRSFYCTRET